MLEKVIFTPEAANDVAEAYAWYEEREPGLGRAVSPEKVFKALDMIEVKNS